MGETEVVKREAAARSAIKQAFGTEASEDSANLFVSHHLEELGGNYWQKHLGTETPEPALVLDVLVLRSHWSADDADGLDTFDFTLPDEATNYVLSVHFGEDGKVEEISMESKSDRAAALAGGP